MHILMPQLGETVSEGTIIAWRRQAGEAVAAEEVLLEIETDKAAVEVPAPAAGTITRILVAAGETVPVGAVLADFEPASTSTNTNTGTADAGVAVGTTAAPAAPPASASGATSSWDRLPKRDSRGRPISPAVRRLAQEHGIQLDRVEGSGRAGRVRLRDALAHVARPIEAGSRIVPFNRLRKRTAEHMLRSKATSPHVLQAVEVDFDRVESVRAALKNDWHKRHGYALTFLPFVAYAVCRAIAEFPAINSSVEDQSLRIYSDVNLSIAVDLSFEGLVAPVLRKVQLASVGQLAARLHELTQRARAGKLGADDFHGGTYTISNSGSFGTLITAPVINQPQVAILSMDGIRKRPVVVESDRGDAIAIRPVGVLAQSFDHRAIDGAYSAAFLRKLREILENTRWETLVELRRPD